MLGLSEAVWIPIVSGLMALLGAVLGILLKGWLDRQQEKYKTRSAHTYPKAFEALTNIHSALVEAYKALGPLSLSDVEKTSLDEMEDVHAKLDALWVASLRAGLYLRNKQNNGADSAVRRAVSTFLRAYSIVQYEYAAKQAAQIERLEAEYRAKRAAYLAQTQEGIKVWEHIVDIRRAVKEVEEEIGREIDITELPEELKDTPQLVGRWRRELQEEAAQQQGEASTNIQTLADIDEYKHLKEGFNQQDINRHYIAAVDALAPLLRP